MLELGAGTGKLTASLVAAGHQVVATDPAEPMLRQLVTSVPTEVVRCGAEHLPFRSESFDLVAVAQAFHWFDRDLAVPEIARVLRPGGHLALVWNFREESVPWVRRLSAIIGSEDVGTNMEPDGLAEGVFGAITTAEFRFWQDLDREGLLGLVRSRSYVVALGQSERAEVLARVDGIYDDYGQRDGLRLPYRTKCYRLRVDKQPDATPAEGTPDDGSLLFDLR